MADLEIKKILIGGVLALFAGAAIATDSPNKLLVTNLVISTALVEHMMVSECSTLVKSRPPEWSRVAKVLVLAKPYMTKQELADLSSGRLLEAIKREASLAYREMMNVQLANFPATPREKCMFAAGFVGGQKASARDLLKDLGQPYE